MDEKPAPPNRSAVAIADNAGADRPVITASGKGWRAEHILRVAFDHGVKVREDATLAEMLAAFEENSPIPIEALYAVSEVLSRVYAASRSEPEESS